MRKVGLFGFIFIDMSLELLTLNLFHFPNTQVKRDSYHLKIFNATHLHSVFKLFSFGSYIFTARVIITVRSVRL